MSDRVRATILQLTDCMNRHDAEAASKLFAENVLFWEPSYDEPRHGRAAVRREFEGFFFDRLSLLRQLGLVKED